MTESNNCSPLQPLQTHTGYGFRTMAVMTAKGVNRTELLRILAGQLLMVAAMADASSLSIVSLFEPHASTSGLEVVPLLLLRFQQLGGEIVARNVVGKW
ncbi:hypothetical protein Tco_1011718 [Tanacetum coccineum]